MKRAVKLIALLITLFFITNLAKAEYNGWHLTIEIETSEGKELIGYTYMAWGYINLDSLENTNYLKRALQFYNAGSLDSLEFYADELKYNFNYPNDTNTYAIYGLLNKTKLALNQITSIKVTNKISQSYISNITSKHTLADKVWLNQPALSIEHFGGYLCDIQIFIHENSKALTTLINQLKQAAKQAQNQESYDADNNFLNLAQQLDNFKVLVITTCTC